MVNGGDGACLRLRCWGRAADDVAVSAVRAGYFAPGRCRFCGVAYSRGIHNLLQGIGNDNLSSQSLPRRISYSDFSMHKYDGRYATYPTF